MMLFSEKLAAEFLKRILKRHPNTKYKKKISNRTERQKNIDKKWRMYL